VLNQYMNISFSGYRIVPDDLTAKVTPREKFTQSMDTLQNLVASHREKLESGPLQNTDVEIIFRPIDSGKFADNLDEPALDTRITGRATYRINNNPTSEEHLVYATQEVPYTLKQLGGLSWYGLLTNPFQFLGEIPEMLVLAVKAPFVKPEKTQDFIKRFVTLIQKDVAAKAR
jgi:hypothetical protein